MTAEVPVTSALQHAKTLRRAADRLAEKAPHVPGANDDGVRYCQTCNYAWPCPPLEASSVAVIEVWHGGPGSRSWPLAERVPGGWQSGGEHYPDATVAEATPHLGPRDMRDSLAACLYGVADRIESMCASYSTVLVPIAWLNVANAVLAHD